MEVNKPHEETQEAAASQSEPCRDVASAPATTLATSEPDPIQGFALHHVHTPRLPIGVQIQADQAFEESPSARGRQLLFVGKLDWAPNREGLEWLLRNVWPQVAERAPDLKLTIVGSNSFLHKARATSISALILFCISTVSSLYNWSLHASLALTSSFSRSALMRLSSA